MEWIKVPQINANEAEVEVVEVAVEEGQAVEAGEVICTLESTKATLDLEAPQGGYVRALAVEVGQRVAVGTPICALTQSPDEEVTQAQVPTSTGVEAGSVTRRAAALIAQHGLDPGDIDSHGIVTERDVLRHLGGGASRDLRATKDRPRPGRSAYGDTPDVGGPGAVVLYGAGGHARVVIEMIRQGRPDLEVVAVVDDGQDCPKEVLGIPVVGDASHLATLRERGVGLAALGVGAVTHNALRATLFDRLVQLGFELPNLIHPSASVEPSVRMGRGNQIFAGAVISSAVTLGDNGIINSNAVVSHDCRLGDHVHVTPGAMLAGGVTVGPRSVIGMGVTIYLGVEVGADVVVPNGSHLVEDLRQGERR